MTTATLDIHEARGRLAASAEAIVSLVADVGDDEAGYHPRSGAWSILEVMGHLCIEEVEDFRARFASTVRDAKAPWPAIDPEARVREGAFDERALRALIEAFREARGASLAYLASLSDVDLSVTYHHPRGPLRAGDLLASWVAHDLFHARQLVRIRYAYLARLAAPYRVEYAGSW